MEITAHNHFFALVGSLATITGLVFSHSLNVMKNKTKMTTSTYIRLMVVPFICLGILPQLLVFVQEYAAGVWFEVKGISDGWELYFDHEEIISFLNGVFGNLIFIKAFKLGSNKITNT